MLYHLIEQKFYRTIIRFESPFNGTYILIYSSQISRKGTETMETTMYTFTANEIVVAGSAVRQASGGDRRMVYVRHPVNDSTPAAEGKVIDFNAWRAAKEEADELEAAFEADRFDDELFEDEFTEEDFPAEELQVVPSVRRPRTHHRAGGMYLDWVASAALVVVALCASVSFFLL